MKKRILTICCFLCGVLFSQTPTMGLMQHSAGSLDSGYVLFPPTFSDTTYLIDKCGKKIHQWVSGAVPGVSAFLLADGSILRSEQVNNSTFNSIGERGGKIERIDWNGNVVWSYVISDTVQKQNHDIYPMPNGNILVCVWVNIPSAQAIADGRSPALIDCCIWSARIVELQPVGTSSANIVWQWDLWDHLIQEYDNTKNNYGVVVNHPELLDLNFNGTNPAKGRDWIHLNAVDYNQQLDQIVISAHNLHEIYIIDHSTTTAEAASHSGGTHGAGGDFLYRWGNPAAYNRGTSANRKFYFMHTPRWIPQGFKDAGKIMIYNNGYGRPAGNYSSVDIISPPIDALGNYTIASGQPFGPTVLDWTYTAPVPTDFYSQNMSGAQRLANGNTLICEAAKGKFFEIDSLKNIVWEYINPASSTGNLTQGTTPASVQSFRADFYTSSFVAGSGYPLTPGNPIELSPYNYTCSNTTNISRSTPVNKLSIIPNPSTGVFKLSLEDEENVNAVEVLNAMGQKIISTKKLSVDLSDYPAGIYFLKVYSFDGSVITKKIIKQ